MIDCNYCHKQMLNGQDIDSLGDHVACGFELNKRCKRNICVRCGKNSALKSDILCSDCKINNSDYNGYGI